MWASTSRNCAATSGSRSAAEQYNSQKMINNQTLRTCISPWVREFAHVNLALALLVEGAGTHAEEFPQALGVDTLAKQVPVCPDMLWVGA